MDSCKEIPYEELNSMQVSVPFVPVRRRGIIICVESLR